MLARLGLERANPKIIRCVLHRYALGGRELDNINARFNERYCNTCKDRSPRPTDWQFYDENEEQP